MFLFAGSIIMLGWALISMLFGFQPTFLFGACGAALMSGYIIYDTHKVPIPPLPPSPFPLPPSFFFCVAYNGCELGRTRPSERAHPRETRHPLGGLNFLLLALQTASENAYSPFPCPPHGVSLLSLSERGWGVQIMTRMGPDDYIIACVELYTDLITLFIYILDMLSARN